MTDDLPACDHCTIRIRSLTCRTDTEAFGVACIACRQTLRDDPDADIPTVDPQPIAAADRQSFYGDAEDENASVEVTAARVRGESA